MDNLPKESFVSWHYSIYLPLFLKKRQNQLISGIKFFNFTGLLKNLFSPYKRMVAREKTSLADRLSFNLISIFVGAGVRLTLLIAGLISIPFLLLFQIILTLMWLVLPFLSYPEFTKFKNNTIFASDLETSQKLTSKLASSNIVRSLCLFFEDDFQALFANLPQPSSIQIKAGQSAKDAILTLVAQIPAFGGYFKQKNVKTQDFSLLVEYVNEQLENPPSPLPKPLGQLLSFGYTNTLDRFGTDLTAKTLPITHLSEDFLIQVQKVLTRPQNNNILLVGEPGVGKHTMLEGIAAAIQKFQLPGLAEKRLILLDTIALVGLGKNLPETKINFENILKEAKTAGNIILAIDQIDRILSTAESRIDLSEVITGSLTDNSLPIIGITTIDQFNQFIRPNTIALNLFEKINVEESTQEETLSILIGKSLQFYKSEKISATLKALLEIIESSSRLITDSKQPEKSIILLEDAIAEAKAKKTAKIGIEIIDSLIAQKTKTPLGKITESEGQKLADLETILHKRVIGQDEAIIEIAKAMRRARTQIETSNKPMGSFLFLGPTGVGKTETAKALAEAYFGAEDKMVRLDMSEYQGPDSLERLIGNPQTKTPGSLTSLIREHPFGLLLLDEFEKANTQAHNLFLQILDEGFLTDAFGKKVNFVNNIIIATSNAGSEFIREEVKNPNLSKDLIDHVLSKGLFTPELINRFDAVVVYHPLTPDQVIQIAGLMLAKLAKKLAETKNISLEVTPQLAQLVAQKGFDSAFGARPIRRLIQDKIEDEIAKLIISGQIQNGSAIPANYLQQFLA